MQIAALANEPKDGVGLHPATLYEYATELIFDMWDGLPIFHAIMSSIDTDRIDQAAGSEAPAPPAAMPASTRNSTTP